jgi:probable O-glycosylation ligase (exosortase A-associated)
VRDVLLMSIILPAALVALRHPWIGVLLWVWVSLMNPHRYTYGFAFSAPVALIAAASTLVGLLATRDKHSPFLSSPPKWLAVLVVWITITWLMGRDPAEQFGQWDKVMKVYLMVFVTLMLFRTKLQIQLLVWVMTLSVALLSAKGGLFTIANGGAYRVWGPPGSWIEGNNDFAVATIMTIPLLRFMQLQVNSRWLAKVFTVLMLLSAAAALGSHSRGAFLAIVAMTAVLWWRGQNKGRNGVLLVLLGVGMVAAMPDNWSERMDTIQTYQTDESALGRLSAWWVAWGIGKNELFGVGFSATYIDLFMTYSPYWEKTGQPVAHSIWFQMMGHHGMIGFLLFVALWVATWRVAGRLRKAARLRPELKWVGDLGAMCQVCLVGYWAGGAFLQLGYYDFPYYVMAVVVVTDAWVRRESWLTDIPRPGGWRSVMGISAPLPRPVGGVTQVPRPQREGTPGRPVASAQRPSRPEVSP